MSSPVVALRRGLSCLGLVVLLLAPSLSAAQQPFPTILDWVTDPQAGTVHFQVRWTNTGSQPTVPVSGTMSSQPFGVFQQNHAPIGDFQVPSLAVDSFFDIFYEVALEDLPPAPRELLPGGGPGDPGVRALADSASCPPDDHWDGNVDLVWQGPGTAGQVGVHYGTLQVCPGAGASYIHVRPILCNAPGGASWTVTGLCPGFNVTVVNEDFSPAPAIVPLLWSGWLCVTADPSVPVGASCCPQVVFNCGGDNAAVTLCVTACDWGVPPDPVVAVPDWTTNPATGTVQFSLHWTNPGTQTSKPASGTISSQMFGVFQPDFGPIGAFNVPPLAPDSFFDVFFEVPLADLPPAPAKVLPNGSAPAPGVTPVADASCPPDDHWDGNVDITWSSDGLPTNVNKHYGSLQVCPGGGASYIHLAELICNAPGGIAWSIQDLCPGFNATLVNQDYTPAPAALPPNWMGWICVTADPSVAVGDSCCPKVVFDCAGETAEVELCVKACDWGTAPDPVLTVPDWTTTAGVVRFTLHWSNPGQQTSKPASGNLFSQQFGVFQPTFGHLGSFNVPPLAPDSFFDVFIDIPLSNLPPPPPKFGPGGGGGGTSPGGVTGLADAPCPPDEHWDGNVDVVWFVDGLPAQVNVHYGSIQLCPGGGPSYIHVPALQCPSPTPVTWTVAGLCPGFNATLVNEDFTPAPAALPPFWSGWICLTAAANLPSGIECCPTVTFVCDGEPAVITLCATTCDWDPGAPDPVVTVPDWTTNPATGMVQFQIHVENPDLVQTSHPGFGTLSSQPFGAFQANAGTIGTFEIPPLAPDSFFDVFIEIPLSSLPPPPVKVLPGAGPPAPGVRALADSASCPPDDHWDGNVDLIWQGAGAPSMVNVHYGSLRVCPGAGNSYIHIPALICNAPAGVSWTIADVCPGFTVGLVNEDYTPAPPFLPPNWTGWICVSAGAGVPIGIECCPKVIFDCDGVPGEVVLCAQTCDWSNEPDPVLTVPDWTTDVSTGEVVFTLHWENPNPQQSSKPAQGTMSSQMFGVFQPDFGPIGAFNVPALAPDSFFDITYRIDLDDLPPAPVKTMPGGAPAPGVTPLADGSCPPDDHWDGNVDITWSSDGLPTNVNKHYGSLQVCPGGGASYIHLAELICNAPGGISWSIQDVCPGFTVTLVQQDYTPAPPFLPPNFMGWICVTADSSVAVGDSCCPKVVFDCGGDLAAIDLCVKACDWGTAPDPVVSVPDWTTHPVTGNIQFTLRWENPDPNLTSKPAQGTLSSQPFGVFQPNHGAIGNFNVPPLAPDSFFDVVIEIPLSSLPPPPVKLLPGGGPPAPGVNDLADPASCPPDDHWDGNVDVVWSTDGLPAQVNVHYGSMKVCPGAGASYIHIPALQCVSPVGVTWSVQDLCPGFTATLVNEDFSPAPPALPPLWTGWICVTAAAGTPVGAVCCPKVVFDCDGVPAEITLCTEACDWSFAPDPVLTIPDWTTNLAAGTVRFTLHWSNPNPQQASNPVAGTLSSQPFGVFQQNFGTIASFNVPALAPDSFFDIWYDVAIGDLPPSPQQALPGGGPGAPGIQALADSVSCPPEDHWDGNVDVIWTGGGELAQVNVHYGEIRTCPGGGASYIHIQALACPNPVTWSVTGLCAGFTAGLVNEDFTPAPAALPVGWTGWICIEAGAAVLDGVTCCPRVIFDCDGVPAEVTLCTSTCSWAVGGVPADRPAMLTMQARPNPMFGSTTVSFHAEEAGEARIEVFSAGGRLVRNLFSGRVPQGEGAVVWNGRDDNGEALSAGIYLVRMTLAGTSVTNKVSLLSD